MGSLTPAKSDRLSLLLSTLPGVVVEQLLSVAHEADPSLGRLLAFCKAGPERAARDLFFLPAAPIIADRAVTKPSLAQIPEALIAPLWDWIKTEVTPEAADMALEQASQFDDPPGEDALDEMRFTVATRITQILDDLKEEPKAAKQLRHRLGVTDFDDVRAVAEFLKAAPSVRIAMEGAPARIEDLNDTISAALRDRYEDAAEAQPEAGVWVLLMMLPRLKKPWQLLRVFERIARREDDFLLSRTDMSSVGEALLDDAEFYLAGFARAPKTMAEAEASAERLADFATVTIGMTREIGIRKDGAWGQKLFALRNAASTQMEAIHEMARQTFKKAVPETGGPRRLRPIPHPGEPEFDEAEAMGQFLYRVKDDASRAAVGNAHNTLLDELRHQLEDVGTELLEGLRTGSSKDAEADYTRLNEIVRLMDVLGEREAGAVLLRRAAAAKAA